VASSTSQFSVATTSVSSHLTQIREESLDVHQRSIAHIKSMEAMVESSLKPATEALYAVLTDELEAKADQLLGCGML
jgi:hypothetical protein